MFLSAFFTSFCNYLIAKFKIIFLPMNIRTNSYSAGKLLKKILVPKIFDNKNAIKPKI